MYIRGEVMDRVWNTLAGAGWDDAQRFMQFGTSDAPCLWRLRAAVEFASQVGMERIERRPRELADYLLSEMRKRGGESWTSPDAALRCGPSL